MPEFAYADLLPTGTDETTYRLVTTEGVRAVDDPGNQTLPEVALEACQDTGTAIVIGGTPAEFALTTAKYASAQSSTTRATTSSRRRRCRSRQPSPGGQDYDQR